MEENKLLYRHSGVKMGEAMLPIQMIPVSKSELLIP
jgi:hypothetical protein